MLLKCNMLYGVLYPQVPDNGIKEEKKKQSTCSPHIGPSNVVLHGHIPIFFNKPLCSCCSISWCEITTGPDGEGNWRLFNGKSNLTLPPISKGEVQSKKGCERVHVNMLVLCLVYLNLNLINIC